MFKAAEQFRQLAHLSAGQADAWDKGRSVECVAAYAEGLPDAAEQHLLVSDQAWQAD